MCFERKDKSPFPMGRKGTLRLEDFRGTFEHDDGGHRILIKDGIVYAPKAHGRDHWPESWLEEETSLSEEFIPIEDELEAAPDGTRILALNGDINYEEGEEEEGIPIDTSDFKLDPRLLALREEMSNPENIQKWVEERYGNLLKQTEMINNNIFALSAPFQKVAPPEIISLRTPEHERQNIHFRAGKISRDRLRAWNYKPPAKKPWFKTKRHIPKSVAILNAMTKI